MNKVLNGRLPRRQRHALSATPWFDVELLRRGTTTTVKVDGVTVFDRVQQGQQSKSDVGVIAHRAKARFDSLTIADLPER
jgi:hypothetical protein